MDLIKAIDIISNDTNQNYTKTDKLNAIQFLANQMINPIIRNTTEFPRFLTASITSLLKVIGDTDISINSAADENLNKLIHALKNTLHIERIMYEIFKLIKTQDNEKSQRIAVGKFGELCKFIRPSKCRKYITSLMPLIEDMIKNGGELLQQTLSISLERIFDVLIFYLREVEVQQVINLCIANFSNKVASIRRSASDIIICICNLYPKSLFQYVVKESGIHNFLVEENIEVTRIQGVFYNFSKLLRLSDSMSKRTLDPKNPMIDYTPLLTEVIVKFISHDNHNVVNGTIELLTNLLGCYGDTLLHRAWFKKEQKPTDENEEFNNSNGSPVYEEENFGELEFVPTILVKLENLLKDKKKRTGIKATTNYAIGLNAKSFENELLK
eukprot:TRINITY_DN17181_c0_g1_i1.p1 TRINITY_DN17181_c0_g1~~TRINITY_DN17181_c0_g1_i1.p1  ORF type:complete len:384 (+),score=68.95 TRINITY_DN17181_c0_g1_i1:29-1180(+)